MYAGLHTPAHVQALHIMAPILDLNTPPTDYTKALATAFKAESGVDVVPTYVPAAQVNSEIEFEVSACV